MRLLCLILVSLLMSTGIGKINNKLFSIEDERKMITQSLNNYSFTKALYNGTITYDGMIDGCLKEYKNSKPCDYENLLAGTYWKFNYVSSWVISLANFDWQGNCQGFTSDERGVMGSCIMEGVSYITQCSCDMKQPLCCFSPLKSKSELKY